ncbi:bifunctional diaminohydroxyphosphoribosylaminopyrimidine deaminase/5-amino-6-(5-phosphoribosylamino)uracil reductase RibD [Blattabacterium cuenoti]|uniref:bifunctional diaminohydroxyphosphoribosylaminopyrimidine deaminase/5-amino-6-(5-phosphoribosylamino)uracil reductase RibD n=1 Tax=Blattabacterium cuenoti TaxID=1653831 RepID=UPI00163CBD96|nr:bifunctional diaminohydroxyphosphoribosylaminopyrimidine deaminase/5-amino-6-(5-phosphoribosylamino)uracil reductase RibD [Blattabacterium cuenoti]
MKIKKLFMERAIQLANNGIGIISPNPIVGCVIEINGLIISEAWNYQCENEHAEVKAINKIKNDSLFLKSTLYVTLEPCSHLGTTPSCVDLIIKKKISIVVIGAKSPFIKSRIGIKKLKKYGIKVIENYLHDQCRIINKRFFTFYEKNRPFIILKWDQSYDGFIASSFKKNECISNIYSRQLTHKWRSEEDSILVGEKTILMDNPELNTIKWNGKNPVKIFLDKELSIPNYYHLFDNKQDTIIFTEKKIEKKNNKIEFIQICFDQKLLEQILFFLFKKKIQSIIVEGGKKILEIFIKKNIWDESRVFISNKIFNDGLNAPIVNGNIILKKNIDTDILIIKSFY